MPVLRNDRPYRTLVFVFLGWKVFLLAIAAGSQVGPTYDSSSSLVRLHDATSPVQALLTRLVSWDAIFFVKAAQRGYLFEQEWAFGPALPTCISSLIRGESSPLAYLGLVATSPHDVAHLVPLVGVVFTNACHLSSSLILYQLGLLLWADSTWALVAALLHILSPAGLFLSAPYAESPFSLLTFVGWLLLAKSCSRPGSTSASVASHGLILLSGITFGLATVFRTNGLLNGAPFAFEFLLTLYRLVEDPDMGKTPAYLTKIVVLGLSGLSVAAGFIIPQFWAYRTYCSGPLADASPGLVAVEPRPWCLSLVPSIYNFVQRHYWDNGFLRYWTVPNAPLFLLAAPMLFVMGKGGKDIYLQASRISHGHKAGSGTDSERLKLVVRSMAAVQILLVVLALANNHIQIITRLSSGYPAWYWWVAACLRSPKTRQLGSGLVVFAVMYASIQSVLFASFLPPA